MSAEPQQGAISAAFPAPPPFYKSFTPDNLALLQQHTQHPSSQTPSETTRSTFPPIASAADLTSLPAELRNLISPQPPADGKYRSFGALHNINPPEPTTQAIPTRTTLLNLTGRLLQLFRRYIQIMATNPSGELWVPQWEEIRKTFEEVHGVINEYRPHEARESLIMRYEDQIRQVKEETKEVRDSVERAKRVLEELGAGNLEFEIGGDRISKPADRAIRTEKERSLAREKRVWEIIEREVGSA